MPKWRVVCKCFCPAVGEKVEGENAAEVVVRCARGPWMWLKIIYSDFTLNKYSYGPPTFERRLGRSLAPIQMQAQELEPTNIAD